MVIDGKLMRLFVAGTVLVVIFGNRLANAQNVDSLANLFSVVENWAKLPTERPWGQVIGVEIDPDGKSVWVFDRCGPKGCMDSIGKTINPIQRFDRDGKLVTSFGAGLFNWPHGFFVDREGNVWATDGIGINGKGNTAFKFSPEGKMLLMLGRPGVAGDGQDTFNWPSDVVVGMNGDIFIADGHGAKSNARIVKFTKDGKFIKAWGREGSAAGEFDVPHGVALDRQGRLFVADRSNNRIQIFDQDGKFIDAWTQFGRPSGLFIDQQDTLYVADSQSGEKYNAPFQQGIRIGSASDGRVTAFIRDPGPGAPESLAADDQGNVFGGFIEMQTLKKYVRN
jgi:sugar lactone lactonase YvrE